jgi:hypothetical protein
MSGERRGTEDGHGAENGGEEAAGLKFRRYNGAEKAGKKLPG